MEKDISRNMQGGRQTYHETYMETDTYEAGSLKMNTALEYSTRVVQEEGRRCKGVLLTI
jgi:hypothetical protein